ncbi:DUF4876 domain-containing protein [Parapedobacter sp. DT-150]|uniref:DUF4876 domain-containing protein n=1 Tax=Parapedobacter sp. DT-150 TaxID=3396162 RepID=UPI003F1C9E27
MKTIVNTKTLLMLALGAGLVFTACTKDELSVDQTAVSVTITNPPQLEEVEITAATLTLTEINSGAAVSTTELENGRFEVAVPAGSYDVTLEGTVSYMQDGQAYTSAVRGRKEGAVFTGSSAELQLELFLHSENAGFVLQEIYFTGSLTPEGKQYNGDKYFIIYNNSDEVLYADGLVFAESEFLTTTKRDYTPNIMSEAFTAGNIVMIPGSGQEYPVQPGESVVVANNAIDHVEYNSNSIDLSGADFEITLLPTINVDNPQVTDLINVAPYLTMHNRGFKSYVLAKFEGDVETFKTTQTYEYTYLQASGSERTVETYKIPNEWILDAVNLSVESEYQWILTDPSLDMGWTHCGTVDSDDNRYGKSVRRKVLSTGENGREILQDTNNSTEDFETEAALSLQ